MRDLQVATYASASLSIAKAEQALPQVEGELFRMRQAIAENETLASTLVNGTLPVELRQGIIEDLLKGIAHPVTTAIVSMIIASGHAHDLPQIIERFLAFATGERGEVIAEARSAVELSRDQENDLGHALTAKFGKKVSVRSVVDPSVLGGIRVQIGDTVIDGSVRNRLQQLKESL